MPFPILIPVLIAGAGVFGAVASYFKGGKDSLETVIAPMPVELKKQISLMDVAILSGVAFALLWGVKKIPKLKKLFK